MRVLIGTSGFSYADWVGAFYPPGTPPRRMLALYCRQFPLVELNFTFYRTPAAGQLARLADQTSPAFRFLVKIPQTLSHDQNPGDLAGFRDALEELRQRQQLEGILCQLPQACHDNRENRAWLEYLGGELGPYRLAIEFRHCSWFRPDVTAWLAEKQIDLVSVDVPDIPALYPGGLVQSGSRIYVRWHSRSADNWYRNDKERYDYDYNDTELTEWVESLRGVAGRAEQALLLFNNCHRAQAAANANRMRELLARMAPELQVVEADPAPEPSPQQRLLFDDL